MYLLKCTKRPSSGVMDFKALKAQTSLNDCNITIAIKLVTLKLVVEEPIVFFICKLLSFKEFLLFFSQTKSFFWALLFSKSCWIWHAYQDFSLNLILRSRIGVTKNVSIAPIVPNYRYSPPRCPIDLKFGTQGLLDMLYKNVNYAHNAVSDCHDIFCRSFLGLCPPDP